jgi:chromosome partition protein MukB
MNRPFLRPQEVHAEALFLIGYRLYPYARIDLHPRLTLLAGGNGVGKTTMLDAFQTILIADQRYLHMNVASGQNDRDMGGQMQGRVAWAALSLVGHAGIGGIGVHLSRRAAAEYVDLKPFALIGTPPEQDMFLCRDTSMITSDLKELNKRVVRHSTNARVREFASLNDYHRFLYEEGLLPLDLSRGGRRRFSLLWRQATQPHLGELNNFLQQTLCHEPEKKLTFEDVEKLMRERLHAERQLNRLGELKELDSELRDKASELDHHRRRYFAANLGQIRQKVETFEQEISEGERGFKELDEQIGALKEEIEAVRAQLAELGKERDKYLREQGDWSRKYKHHQEYTALKRLSDELQEELSWVQEDVFPLEANAQDARDQTKRLQGEMQVVSNDLARWKDKERDLERQVVKWREFRKDLEHAAQILGKEVATASELEAAWLQTAEEKRGIQELKALKQLLGQWESRANAHESAVELAGKMANLWPEFFDGKEIDHALLDQAQVEMRRMEKEIAVQRQELTAEKKPLNGLIGELSKGRLPLPSAPAALVEEGLALPFVRHFDRLELEAARKCQESIGPLAHAIEPADPPSLENRPPSDQDHGEREPCEDPRLSGLARGSEPFWLALSPEVWKELRILARSEHGTIAGFGGIGWYVPNGPVWIGAEARREQIRRAQERLLEIEAQLKDLNTLEGLIAQRMKAIQNFLPKLDALADNEAREKVAELRERVSELEQAAPQIEKAHSILQRLFQRSELFGFVHAPEEIEQLRADIASTEERHRALEENLKASKAQESQIAKEQARLQSKLQEIRRELDRIETICSRLEDEEPEEVLQGRMDFGRAEELEKRIKELDEERERTQNTLSLSERKHGELRNRFRAQSEAIARQRLELSRAQSEHDKATGLWNDFYPGEAPQYMGANADEGGRHKALWDNLVQALKSRLNEVSAKYDLHLPEEDQPDRCVLQLLQMLLPPGVEPARLEEQYSRLQHELQQIEHKIKGHVEGIRSNVEAETRRLRMHMARVNRILSTLSFGQIKKIYLEVEELPAFQALKKLESFLRVIQRDEVITLREFVEKLRAFILRESNTTLTEEQIADYRSYIRIRRVIVDKEDRVREGGLSSGETLGVNLALCLSILFFLGREQGANSDSGMLMLALDEAERLDVRALATIRDLLDEVRCQLMVAMPRPVDIADSICHLLTPLSQGVTHVHLYHRGGNGDINQTPCPPT